MTKLDELPNLCKFVEDHLQHDTGIISQDVANELKLVVEFYQYSGYKGDIAEDQENIDELRTINESLKSKVRHLEQIIEEHKEQNSDCMKSYHEINNAMVQMSAVHNEYTSDLLNQVKTYDEENSKIVEENETFKKRIVDYEIQITKLLDDIQSAKAECQKYHGLYAGMKEQLEDSQKQLKEISSQKEKDSKNHQRSLNILNSEGMKLRKQIEIHKQSDKTNEFLIKSLRSENKELKNDMGVLKERLETMEARDRELGDILVKQLKVINCSDDDVSKIMVSIGKQQQNDRSLSGNGNNISDIKYRFNSSQYENLESYEDIFNNSLSFDKTNSCQEQDSNKLNSNPLELPKMIDNIANVTEESVKKENNEDIQRDSAKRANMDSLTVSPYVTTKEELSRNLDTEIKKRLSFMSQRKTNTNKELDMPTSFNTQNCLNIMPDIRSPLEIDERLFKSLINNIEEYLNTDKNPTTFRFNEFDKSRMLQRFEKADKKSLKVTVISIIKAFIQQMDFLEGNIKNLTMRNSQLMLKNDDLKYEINYLMKTFLEKNKKNQDYLNNAAFDFKKYKKDIKTSMDGSNSKKLSKEVKGIANNLDDNRNEDSGSSIKHTTNGKQGIGDHENEDEDANLWTKFKSMIKLD